MTERFSRRLLLGAGVSSLATPALAQSFPSKPVRLIVPFAPGGQTDILARMLAQQLAVPLGQTVVVENRSGGATMIAAEHVARAAKDGHTVLFGGPSPVVINPLMMSRMPYRPEELEPVILLCSFPFIITVRNSVPAIDPRSFVTYARSQPASITYASVGRGSSTHIAGEILAAATTIRMTDVIYRGIAPALSDLMGEKIDAMVDSFGQAIPYHRSGRYRIVGTMGRERWPTMPDIQTFTEAGFPEAVSESWFGIFVPAGTPAEATSRLNASFNLVLQDETMKRTMLEQGHLVAGGTPDNLTRTILEDRERIGAVVRRLNLRLD